MNVNLGAPYEAILKKIIEREYAGNATEAIRQALMAYEKKIEEESVLVDRAMKQDIEAYKSGKMKTTSLEQAIKNGVFD